MGKNILEGIKIADFSWVGVGPITTSYLAQYGAEVVRVESSKRPELLRVTPPFRGNTTHVNKSAYFANFNVNKYGMCLNLNHPKACEIAKRLVMWADVVAESFTPGVMAKWGLGYSDLVKIKPDIIMFSTCQQGQTGPHASLAALGTQLVSLAGFTYLTGWPDRPPTGPYGPYTDIPAPYFATTAILAALRHRRKTGRGIHIDIAQFETAIQFLAPLVLDYFANGTVANGWVIGATMLLPTEPSAAKAKIVGALSLFTLMMNGKPCARSWANQDGQKAASSRRYFPEKEMRMSWNS